MCVGGGGVVNVLFCFCSGWFVFVLFFGCCFVVVFSVCVFWIFFGGGRGGRVLGFVFVAVAGVRKVLT